VSGLLINSFLAYPGFDAESLSPVKRPVPEPASVFLVALPIDIPARAPAASSSRGNLSLKLKSLDGCCAG